MRIPVPLCVVGCALSLVSIVACGGNVRLEGDGGSSSEGGGPSSAHTGPVTVSQSSGSGDACFGAAPGGFSFTGDGKCPASSEGLQCQWHFADTATSESGVVQCVAGSWTRVECPYIDTSFSCAGVGGQLNSCDSVWAGLTCDWQVADAGFWCNGRAQCDGSHWVSLGIDGQGEPSTSVGASTSTN